MSPSRLLFGSASEPFVLTARLQTVSREFVGALADKALDMSRRHHLLSMAEVHDMQSRQFPALSKSESP